MFGSVKPYVPDLYVRENEYYKSVYCGLCRSMGKHTTEVSCASLSFDMTFFALTRIWLCEERPQIKSRRCHSHPLKKRPMMCDSGALEFSAYVSAYMTYYKILDDIRDGRGLKRLLARAALIFAKIPMSKIPEKYRAIGQYIGEKTTYLSELEKQKCEFPSEVADVFGDLLGYALAFDLDEKKAAVAYELGKHVGRWVYLADAARDIDRDEKSGSYNPFLCAMAPGEARDFIANGLDGVLSMELVEAMKAYDLGPTDTGECAGCIKNILTKGMRNTLASELTKNKREKKNERSV